MKPEELRERTGEIDSDLHSDVCEAVCKIRNEKDDSTRLASIRAVFDGMMDTEKAVQIDLFGEENYSPVQWSTGRCNGHPLPDEFYPMVGCSLGAPPARFDRIGRPQLDYAAMRFIVTARENFEFLLKLAEKGLNNEKN